MGNSEFIELLKHGVSAWNNHRRLSQEKADLSNTDFSNTDLSGINFSSTNLDNCSFENTKLDDALFHESSLIDTNLDWASCNGARFIETVFSRSTAKNASFNRAIFHLCKITHTDMTNTSFTDARINDVKLQWSILDKADFEGSLIVNLDLHGSEYSSARFNRKLSEEKSIHKEFPINELRRGYKILFSMRAMLLLLIASLLSSKIDLSLYTLSVCAGLFFLYIYAEISHVRELLEDPRENHR